MEVFLKDIIVKCISYLVHFPWQMIVYLKTSCSYGEAVLFVFGFSLQALLKEFEKL